jgi:uncharacterized protein (DUF1778 family)
MEKKKKKLVVREQRIAARVTQELYEALQERAYTEHKTMSNLVVEAVIKFLDFKMPPEPERKEISKN